MADVLSISSRGFNKITKRLAVVQMALGPAFKSVQAQFGAYMKYSLMLEEGTKKMPPRPHILPAIRGNGRWIAIRVGDEGFKLIEDVFRGRSRGAKKDIQKMWVRILNDKPRIQAVNVTKKFKWISSAKKEYTKRVGGRLVTFKPGPRTGIFEFGFHRRSIRGYGHPLSNGEIQAIQAGGKGPST